ncbi:transcriptional regulator [Methanococcus maripaludis C5]|uniref:Transcriptional regulator n=1 Tax=Methanococcus maripaludis (strain C5 / ATCC BAA-1333) TaxID=402880 RepID=A4FYZ1_METM5|nr:winged helix-turn-helix transcriptional regulator [Methanococcus maripaludis]ABO35425.1 transcriptional regulator [Methanococcus maripaludis C5]
MLLKLIAKTHASEIIKSLEKNDELHFGGICKYVEGHKNSINRILQELYDEGIVEKREENYSPKISKSYYKLTDFGKEVSKIIDQLEDLEHKYYEAKNKTL